MNKNTQELNYLEKIENDVRERLWDLLIIHLIDVEDKVKVHGDNQDKLIELLDKSLKILRNGINNYNRLHFYRYTLIVCNKILRYDKKRKDLKEIKKEIIKDYIHSDSEDFIKLPYLTGEKILSLSNQVNEIRLTYDTTYLSYLIGKCIRDKELHKALYCLIVVRLIEPDKEELEEYDRVIHENIKSKKTEKIVYEKPENEVLALDSNVVISKIMYDVGEYRIRSESTFDLEKLGNNNKFVITESVAEEVRKHLEFALVGIKRFCRGTKFDYKEIKEVLEKRLGKMIEKYGVKVSVSSVSEIREFYLDYLEELEKILLFKLRGKYVSKKLRKLAQRESLLPEEGDLKLLAEAIKLNVGILSKDKDFVNFKKEILDKFGVKVYG